MTIFFWGVIISVLIYLVVGLLAGRRVKDTSDYYVCGRNAPTLLITGTLFASMLSVMRIYRRSGLVLQRQYHIIGASQCHLRMRLCIRCPGIRTIPSPLGMYDSRVLWNALS